MSRYMVIGDMVIDHNSGATRNEIMKCKECFFERIPENKYKWMQEINMEGIRCKHRPRIVKGVKKDSIVFGHNCKASDGYCKMDKSMIVWEHQKKDECPFTLITMVELKKARNGVLYDTKNKLAFRTKKVEHCGLTMLLTTENLYIVLNQNTLNQISVLTKISKLKRSGSGELNALDLSVSHELLMSSKNCDLKMMYFSKAKRMVLSQNNKNEVVKANHAFSIDDFFSQREINFPHYTQLLKSAEVIGVLKNSHHI